jgi:hypothetical protein
MAIVYGMDLTKLQTPVLAGLLIARAGEMQNAFLAWKKKASSAKATAYTISADYFHETALEFESRPDALTYTNGLPMADFLFSILGYVPTQPKA